MATRASDVLEGTLMGLLANALSAALGSDITAVFIHPTDTFKTKKIQHNDKYTVGDLWRERGQLVASLPSVLVEASAFQFVFDFCYNFLKRAYRLQYGMKTVPVVPGLLIGMCSGMTTQMLTCPLKVISMGVQTGKYRSMADAVSTIWGENEGAGLANFYRGIKVSLLIAAINPSIDYQVYDRLSALVLTMQPKLNGDLRNLSSFAVFMLGLAAKFCAATVTYPIAVIKVKTQMGGKAKAKANGTEGAKGGSGGSAAATEQVTAAGEVMKLWNEGGFRAFYYGFGPKMLNTTLKAGLKRMMMANVRENTFAFVLFCMRLYMPMPAAAGGGPVIASA